MNEFVDSIGPRQVVFLKAAGKEAAIRQLVRAACRGRRDVDEELIFRELLEREKTVSSWLGEGVALPHIRLPGFQGFLVALGRSRTGVDYHSSGGTPARLIVLIVGGEENPEAYLRLLAAVARRLREPALRKEIMQAFTRRGVLKIFLRGLPARPAPAAGVLPDLSRFLFDQALQVAAKINAAAVLLQADAQGNLDFLPPESPGVRLILVGGRDSANLELKSGAHHTIRLPFSGVNRLTQVDLSLLLALSRGYLKPDDRVVIVSGADGSGSFDTLMVLDLAREFQGFLPGRELSLGEIQPEVLERVLRIAVDLGREGREGKQVGTVFVLGDYRGVKSFSHQLIMNPFQGYPEKEKNILDPGLEETVKEFAALDGAFLVREDGVLMAAGAYLRPAKTDLALAPGLGARHAAAQAITDSTAALAVAVSQSTGTVRLYKGGGMILEIEKGRR